MQDSQLMCHTSDTTFNLSAEQVAEQDQKQTALCSLITVSAGTLEVAAEPI